MARQPRRSAFVLARNQKKFSRSFTINNSRKKKRSRSINLPPSRQLFIFPLIVLLVFAIILDSHAYDSTLSMPSASLVETRKIAVGSGSPDPKFGERLLPRSKQFIGPQSNLSVNRINQLNISNSSNKNVRNSVGYSDNIESSPVNENLIVSSGSSSSITEAVSSPLSAARKSQVNLQSRQGKQLYRRNDDNINDEGEQPNDGGGAGGGGFFEDSIAANLTANNVNESRADRLEMSTEFFIIPSTTSASSIATVSPMRPMGKARASLSGPAIVQQQQNNLGHGPRHVLVLAPKSAVISNASVTPPTILSIHHQNGLRKEPWVIPVLVLASLTMIMMAAFEIFVLFKAWRTSPSRRHLFLGQMLLLGLFACAGLGAIITGQPTILSCGAIRFGVGVAYALVFAALLVKCVFLISLNGGVYLPAPYQGLLLLFAVLIQVAIGSQWLMTQPPEIYTMPVPATGSGYMAAAAAAAAAAATSSGGAGGGGAAFSTSSISFFREMKFAQSSSSSPSASDLITHHSSGGGGGGAPTLLISLCKTQFSELLFSLIYIVFLIVFVAVLAIKSRGIRDNYREATYIGLAIGGAIPIWLGWMLCGLAVADRHKDACIAFGLVATSATVFLVMFMPKGRQLAAMGKEGLYVEDREEQFSSLSRAGSGYSPSFFHFKPIKYGVMGAMPNSASNTGNGNSIKHHSNGLNGGGGGDRVALVTAAPPSYTRMYHYFPAHLTHPFCFYPQPPPPPPPQLPPPMPPTLKALGNSITSMTQAHLAQTLRYPGLFIRPDETNLYTTLEPTLSSNPNVYFQRGGGVHPGMMY